MTKCEYCSHYVYDEEMEADICDVDMDEDDLVRLEERSTRDCPYFSGGDEYSVVRHQI